MEQVNCQIEHHAVLYGLIAKFAMEYGEDGQRAIEEATRQYGLERGKRMAEHARQEGMACNGETYPIFKEWRAPKPEQMVAGTALNWPHYTTTVQRCEWVESWKKHNLLCHGKLYCQHIDENLYEGYQSMHKLSVRSLLSAGDNCCMFDWGYRRSEEAGATIIVQQKEIGEKYIRNFDFHCADLLHKAGVQMELILKDAGAEICLKALKQFIDIFGEAYYLAILSALEQEGWDEQLPWLCKSGL